MSKHVLRAVALAAALLPATCAVAAPLSFDQAIDLAVQRSQMTRSARAGALGAAELARAAGQQPDPMLTVGIDNLPATGRDRFSTGAEDMTMKRIGIAQEWVSADKRAARLAVAGAMTGREAVAERVAEVEARLQAAMAYIDAYYAGEMLALVVLNEKHAREALEAGKGRLATVSGSSAEVLGLHSGLGAAEDETADMRQQQSAAWAALQRWTGVPTGELSEPPPPTLPTQEAFVASNPAVVARERDIEVARRDAQLTRRMRSRMDSAWVARTWFRSASAFPCPWHQRLARIAKPPRSSRWSTRPRPSSKRRAGPRPASTRPWPAMPRVCKSASSASRPGCWRC